MRPNLVVVGVGHAGTTILTQMLGELAWNIVGADARYAENIKVRNANRVALSREELPEHLIEEIVVELNENEPWVIKDPRFSVTLHLWKNVFNKLNSFPVLVHIARDLHDVKSSYIKRKEIVRGCPGNMWKGASHGFTVDEQLKMLCQCLSVWKEPIIDITYEQIKQATALFSV